MKNMVSLVRTDDERMDDMMPSALSDMGNPDVHSGLCLRLTSRDIEKLDLDGLPDKGDLLHLMIMIQVTAIHQDSNGDCVEASIIGGRVENESTESMDEDD